MRGRFFARLRLRAETPSAVWEEKPRGRLEERRSVPVWREARGCRPLRRVFVVKRFLVEALGAQEHSPPETLDRASRFRLAGGTAKGSLR